MKTLATCAIAVTLIGTPALAADMPVKAPPPAPEPVYSWTGFYVGLNAGWSWGKQDTTVNFPGPEPVLTLPIPGGGSFNFSDLLNPSIVNQETNHLNGAIGGVQVGYNWQAAPNWILGIETDFQASGENANGNNHQNSSVPGAFSFSEGGPNPISGAGEIHESQSLFHNDSLLWFGTLRGRVGYAFWPNLMVYATGGLAYGRLNESVRASFNLSVVTTAGTALTGTLTFPNGAVLPVPPGVAASQTFDSSATKAGWTVGGGIEGVVPNTRVTWKAEYLYMDLGTQTYSFSNPLLGTILVSTHFTDNIFRVGLNYQFH